VLTVLLLNGFLQNKGASIKLDHKKWEQIKTMINFDSIFRPYWEGRVPLEESSFKALHNPKWSKMKANQVDITSKRYAEAFVKHKPNPKELMDDKTKQGCVRWRNYENDKAAKHMKEREHCERKNEELNQKWPYNVPVEERCEYGGFDLEFSLCDFNSKNGPNRKCKQKSYHKRMPKEIAGRRRGNNRWRGDSASRNIRRKLKKKRNMNKSWRKEACGDKGWDSVKGKGRRVKCMVSDNM
jgi:hypothetical protein